MATSKRRVTRDISYASSAQTRPGRAFIRVMENATGRLRLIRRAEGYEHEVAGGRDFWKVMADRYGLTLELLRGSLDDVPKAGPLVVIANHPYGILDGLMLGRILSETRGDFRIMAHQVFRKADELSRVILPISFDETKDAQRLNLTTRRTALKYLADGGAIGIFPGGTVSTAPKPFGRPMDPRWRTFTAKMILKSEATVLPIYFDGSNSRLFQVASHMHYTLRMALLIKEFKSRIDAPVRLSIGEPIVRQNLECFAGDALGLMDHLRRATYALAPGAQRDAMLGHEFEGRYRA
ncbi:MAG: lysophospholipid acyltransferase family protein [Pseudomonadota bacterium]